MSEKCNWDPSKHNGEPCPVHGGNNNRQDNSERENLRKEVEYKLKQEGNTSDVRLMAERRGFKIEDGKVVEDLKSQAMADRATGGSGEAFDDTWDEEFEDEGKQQLVASHLLDEIEEVMTPEGAISDKDLERLEDKINTFKAQGKISDSDHKKLLNKLFGEDDENKPVSVDALYRHSPDEDKKPLERKGPADPNAPAGQVLYNNDDEEFLKDMGANLKNTQYGRQETLDEYYERVKDKHTDDMDDWKAFISTAYAMTPKEVDRYISLKQQKDKNKPSGKIDDDFLDNMNDFPAIRRNPKTGEFEVDHGGDGNWSVIDEDEYNALKKKGYQEIDYEEEPEARDDDDLEEGLDELEELVPDSQKNKVKKIKKDLIGDDDKRA